MDIQEILLNPKGKANSRYIKIHWPEDYKEIIKKPGKTFSEQLYNYIYNNPEHKCPVCGKETNFKTLTEGYCECCSIRCAGKNPKRNERSEQTCLKKYGVKNPSQSKEIQKKKEETCLKNFGVVCGLQLKGKAEETCLKKYGVKNPSQSKEIQKKKEETCLKNFGVTSYFKTQKCRDKSIASCLDKYGVKYTFLNKEVREKAKKNYKNKCYNPHPDHIGYTEEGLWIMQCPHPNCNKCEEKTYIIKQQNYNDRKRLQTEPCTKLLPIDLGIKGTSIELFVWSILDEYDIQYETNNRTLISPKELDIYIPSKNIAIECNGLYWHSLKEPKYHINKFKECQERNVQLLSIWEDWVYTKPDILRSILLSKLGLIKDKIYARECIIKEVNSKECSKFLENNHIQGKTPTMIRYGLYYNGQLVSLMTFNKNSKDNNWVLSRFCNKVNTNIIGGASKLFKHFLKEYPGETIISYSSNDISNGHLYETLGFTSNNIIRSAYWYISYDYTRFHRSTFSKGCLKRMGHDITGKTEAEIMSEMPYWRVYDSGTTQWRFNKHIV